MEELKDILARLTTECEIEIEYVKSEYKRRQEKHIINYIRHNVKAGDIFYDASLIGYAVALKFKKCLGDDIVFWNEELNEEVILSPSDFLKLIR